MGASDQALKKEIQEMEKKARKEAIQAAPQAPVEVEEEVENKVSFDQWWMMAQRDLAEKLPHYIKEILRAEFKARGLRNEEAKAKYDQALELYGIKA